jgi:hypothetical protein
VTAQGRLPAGPVDRHPVIAARRRRGPARGPRSGRRDPAPWSIITSGRAPGPAEKKYPVNVVCSCSIDSRSPASRPTARSQHSRWRSHSRILLDQTIALIDRRLVAPWT